VDAVVFDVIDINFFQSILVPADNNRWRIDVKKKNIFAAWAIAHQKFFEGQVDSSVIVVLIIYNYHRNLQGQVGSEWWKCTIIVGFCWYNGVDAQDRKRGIRMASTGAIDRLAILVVSGHQMEELIQQLILREFTFTTIDSSGGMFQEPAQTLLVGLNSSRLSLLLALVQKYCQPQTQYIPAQLSIPPNYTVLPMVEARTGGALVYTLIVERFEQL
jgi:uncharacterized protein YaaQ